MLFMVCTLLLPMLFMQSMLQLSMLPLLSMLPQPIMLPSQLTLMSHPLTPILMLLLMTTPTLLSMLKSLLMVQELSLDLTLLLFLGRTQHVNYHANGYDGYVADVTYEGTAVYPDAPVVPAAPAYHAAPVVAHAPVVAAGYHARPAGQVSHQSVSKPYQGEHRSTTQSK